LGSKRGEHVLPQKKRRRRRPCFFPSLKKRQGEITATRDLPIWVTTKKGKGGKRGRDL